MTIKEYKEKLEADIAYEKTILKQKDYITKKWTVKHQEAFIGGLERALELLSDTHF